MKILAVVPSLYDTSPGQRFRIEQWEPILRSGGVEITYAPFESEGLSKILYRKGHMLAKFGAVVGNLRRRHQEIRSAANYDLVYIFREAALLGPPVFERQIARFGVPIVYDFDDAVFVRYKSPANGYLSYLKFPAKTAEVCGLARHVMAGNEYLADYARANNQNVTIVPTTIDTQAYQPVKKLSDPSTITIGWSGSYSTVQHLDTIRDVLKELARDEKFRLRVIGASEYDLPGVDVEVLPWRSGTEIEDLGAIDIGMMPLPDERWTRGKCGLKALQYMALGIPTICSPVGVNSTIIQDNENGLLARDPAEWVAKLKLLLHSRDLRRKLGERGRQTVTRNYSAEVIAPKVLEIFRSASERT
jgi:glycosyltransferase involved in cell wall biosynthesis